MRLKDFYYDLPKNLIARYPLENRTASRLLCLDHDQLQHRQFTDLPALLSPGDLMVFNNTRVIPARLYGTKPTGGKIEILIERVLDTHHVLAHVRSNKPLKLNTQIHLENDITIQLIARQTNLFILKFQSEKPVLDILHQIGHMPLPPYLEREDEQADQARYQTVFGTTPGAVAAPTAGLHFDESLLLQIKKMGVETTFVTLHVGAGTFQPVRVENIEEHDIHSEYMEISPETCEQIKKTKARGNRVIAVGTTSLRCLETASQEGQIKPFSGDTKLFIYPGYQFHCVDVLITNFHLPESTLLMLVCAFAGYDNIMHAYQEAIKEKYRFFSYGDAMWLNPTHLSRCAY